MTLEIENQRLRDALDHITKTASRARNQTRRTRWIAARALCALNGTEDWRHLDEPVNGDAEGSRKARKLGEAKAALNHVRAEIAALLRGTGGWTHTDYARLEGLLEDIGTEGEPVPPHRDTTRYRTLRRHIAPSILAETAGIERPPIIGGDIEGCIDAMVDAIAEREAT